MVAYNRCLQISFIVVQLCFIALGLTLVGLGVWLELGEQSIQAVINQQQLLYGPYLIIAAGCAVVLIALIGMVGACCDHKINRFLLIFYIILVLLVFAAQLAGGILGFVYRSLLTDLVGDGLRGTIDQYDFRDNATSSDNLVTLAWDTVQTRFSCCGVVGVEDWLFNNTAMLPPGQMFPASCCPSSNCTSVNATNIQGCLDALNDVVQDNLLIVASVAIAFLVGEVIVVLMAFCLVCCTDFDDK